MSLATKSVVPPIKLFLDGADRSQIIEFAQDPLISGFTTNPSLMRKSGVTEYEKYCRDILTQTNGKPISLEVFADDLEGMRVQAKQIATWGKNLHVKIPVINSQGVSTAPLIRDLAKDGIAMNITAVFTIEQAYLAAQALKGGPSSILSVFAGRLADAGHDPVPLIQGCARICDELDPKIELLWASTREAYNILQAAQLGCRVITAPMDVLKKVKGYGKKSALDLSLDTVRTFKIDSEAAGFKL